MPGRVLMEGVRRAVLAEYVRVAPRSDLDTERAGRWKRGTGRAACSTRVAFGHGTYRYRMFVRAGLCGFVRLFVAWALEREIFLPIRFIIVIVGSVNANILFILWISFL